MDHETDSSALDRQAVACEVTHYRQESEAPPVVQLVGHEIHRPDLVDTRRRRPLRPGRNAAVPTWLVPADTKPFTLVQPRDTLSVHLPALPTEPDPDPLVAPCHMHARDLFDTRSEHSLIVLHALVAMRGPRISCLTSTRGTRRLIVTTVRPLTS